MVTRQRRCGHCGEPFEAEVPSTRPGSGKYCSVPCWAAGVRAARTETVTLTCAACGKQYERPKAWVRKSGSKYCSRACQGVGRQREGSSHHRGTGWRKIAAGIRQRDELRCVRCNGQDDDRELAVDHIVPWVLVRSDEAAANHPDNLAALCGSCHGVKTSSIEPRLLRGDWLALQEFYGKSRADVAFARVQHAIKVPS